MIKVLIVHEMCLLAKRWRWDVCEWQSWQHLTSPHLLCISSSCLCWFTPKTKKAGRSVLVSHIRIKLTFSAIIGAVKCFLHIQTMILCKWIKCKQTRTPSKNIYKYYNKSSATCTWALLLWWFICLQLHLYTFYVHIIVCTSEEVIFQPSDSAHKVEPNSYNVTLLPFNHLFDRPMHSVAMVTQGSLKQNCSGWYLNFGFPKISGRLQ